MVNIFTFRENSTATTQSPGDVKITVSYGRDEWGKKWKSLLKAPPSMYCSDTEQSVQGLISSPDSKNVCLQGKMQHESLKLITTASCHVKF